MRWIALLVLMASLAAAPCLGRWIFDGRPSSWEGFQDELRPQAYTYPVVALEMGSGWTDFEVKLSTNNFTNLVYYYKSTGTNAHLEGGLSVDDPDPYVYYTLSCGHTNGITDVRYWHKQVPHEAIYHTLADQTNGEVGGVEFWPSHSVEYSTTNWMSETNVQLVGSWVRIDGVGPETDGGGNQLWRPVALRWAAERRTR